MAGDLSPDEVMASMLDVLNGRLARQEQILFAVGWALCALVLVLVAREARRG